MALAMRVVLAWVLERLRAKGRGEGVFEKFGNNAHFNGLPWCEYGMARHWQSIMQRQPARNLALLQHSR